MEKFKIVEGVIAPLNLADIDTDAIIPKQFLKSIKRTGFGPFLFDSWRYSDEGIPEMDCSKRAKIPDFILNQAPYERAKILLVQENFGCGSSREHAPWAIKDFGFDVVIAPSFGDIFFNNSFKNALLPIVLPQVQVDELFIATQQHCGMQAKVDLAEQSITTDGGKHYTFEVDSFRKHCLINGLDDIALTLEHVAAIKNFEAQHKQRYPWVFEDLK